MVAPVAERSGSLTKPLTEPSSSTASNEAVTEHTHGGGSQQPIALRFLLASTETLICLMEFLFGLTILKSVHQGFFTDVLGLHKDESGNFSQWALVTANSAATLAIIWWTLFRFGRSLRLSAGAVAERLGLFGLGRSRTTFVVVAFIQAVGIAGAFAVQHLQERWIFSPTNLCLPAAPAPSTAVDRMGAAAPESMFATLFSGPTDFMSAWNLLASTCAATGWNWNRIVDILVLAPVREEIVFRGIIVAIFYKRFGSSSALPRDKLACVLSSGAIFGLTHLLNSFGSRYSAAYIGLQVGLGMLIGLFYSLRVERSGSLLQVVILHMINNFGSSFLPTDKELDFGNLTIVIELAQTAIVYSVLIALEWRQISRGGRGAGLASPEYPAAGLPLLADVATIVGNSTLPKPPTPPTVVPVAATATAAAGHKLGQLK